MAAWNNNRKYPAQIQRVLDGGKSRFSFPVEIFHYADLKNSVKLDQNRLALEKDRAEN